MLLFSKHINIDNSQFFIHKTEKLRRHRDSSTILCIVNIQTSSLNTLLYIRLVLMKRNVSMGENVKTLTARILETRNASIINGITRFKYLCIYAHS